MLFSLLEHTIILKPYERKHSWWCWTFVILFLFWVIYHLLETIPEASTRVYFYSIGWLVSECVHLWTSPPAFQFSFWIASTWRAIPLCKLLNKNALMLWAGSTADIKQSRALLTPGSLCTFMPSVDFIFKFCLDIAFKTNIKLRATTQGKGPGCGHPWHLS